MDSLKMDNSQERKQFCCEVCKKAFSTRWYRDQHQLKHSESTGAGHPLDYGLTNENYGVHSYMWGKATVSAPAGTQMFSCEICRKSFSHWAMYQKHWQSHMQQKQDFYCSVCFAEFDAISPLRMHEYEIHKIPFTSDRSGLSSFPPEDTDPIPVLPHGKENGSVTMVESQVSRIKSPKSFVSSKIPNGTSVLDANCLEAQKATSLPSSHGSVKPVASSLKLHKDNKRLCHFDTVKSTSADVYDFDANEEEEKIELKINSPCKSFGFRPFKQEKKSDDSTLVKVEATTIDNKHVDTITGALSKKFRVNAAINSAHLSEKTSTTSSSLNVNDKSLPKSGNEVESNSLNKLGFEYINKVSDTGLKIKLKLPNKLALPIKKRKANFEAFSQDTCFSDVSQEFYVDKSLHKPILLTEKAEIVGETKMNTQLSQDCKRKESFRADLQDGLKLKIRKISWVKNMFSTKKQLEETSDDDSDSDIFDIETEDIDNRCAEIHKKYQRITRSTSAATQKGNGLHFGKDSQSDECHTQKSFLEANFNLVNNRNDRTLRSRTTEHHENVLRSESQVSPEESKNRRILRPRNKENAVCESDQISTGFQVKAEGTTRERICLKISKSVLSRETNNLADAPCKGDNFVSNYHEKSLVEDRNVVDECKENKATNRESLKFSIPLSKLNAVYSTWKRLREKKRRVANNARRLLHSKVANRLIYLDKRTLIKAKYIKKHYSYLQTHNSAAKTKRLLQKFKAKFGMINEKLCNIQEDAISESDSAVVDMILTPESCPKVDKSKTENHSEDQGIGMESDDTHSPDSQHSEKELHNSTQTCDQEKKKESFRDESKWRKTFVSVEEMSEAEGFRLSFNENHTEFDNGKWKTRSASKDNITQVKAESCRNNVGVKSSSTQLRCQTTGGQTSRRGRKKTRTTSRTLNNFTEISTNVERTPGNQFSIDLVSDESWSNNFNDEKNNARYFVNGTGETCRLDNTCNNSNAEILKNIEHRTSSERMLTSPAAADFNSLNSNDVSAKAITGKSRRGRKKAVDSNKSHNTKVSVVESDKDKFDTLFDEILQERKLESNLSVDERGKSKVDEAVSGKLNIDERIEDFSYINSNSENKRSQKAVKNGVGASKAKLQACDKFGANVNTTVISSCNSNKTETKTSSKKRRTRTTSIDQNRWLESLNSRQGCGSRKLSSSSLHDSSFSKRISMNDRTKLQADSHESLSAFKSEYSSASKSEPLINMWSQIQPAKSEASQIDSKKADTHFANGPASFGASAGFESQFSNARKNSTPLLPSVHTPLFGAFSASINDLPTFADFYSKNEKWDNQVKPQEPDSSSDFEDFEPPALRVPFNKMSAQKGPISQLEVNHIPQSYPNKKQTNSQAQFNHLNDMQKCASSKTPQKAFSHYENEFLKFVSGSCNDTSLENDIHNPWQNSDDGEYLSETKAKILDPKYSILMTESEIDSEEEDKAYRSTCTCARLLKYFNEQEFVSLYHELVYLRHKICEMLVALFPNLSYRGQFDAASSDVEDLMESITEVVTDKDIKFGEQHRCQQKLDDLNVVLCKTPKRCLGALRKRTCRFLQMLLPDILLDNRSRYDTDILQETLEDIIYCNTELKN